LPWIENSNPDSLRYFFISNGPENRDSDWSFDLYKTIHNTEVVNKFGNLINRTLKFKGLETLPVGEIDKDIRAKVLETYKEVANNIEQIEFKKAAECAMNLVAETNKFYDEQKPWVQAKEDQNAFNNTIYTCAYVIANLSNIFEPFMPNASASIREFLNLEKTPSWQEIVPQAVSLDKVQPLFTRI